LDRSEVKRIVEANIELLMEMTGVSHWEISISYQPREVTDDGMMNAGDCNRAIDYNSAHITLNPEAFDVEDEVLKTLRHELFHVVLSPFDLYTTAVSTIVAGDAKSILQRVSDHATEKAVKNLERLWYNAVTKRPRSDEPRSEGD
jgi:hypothetical protein